jgi:hypothetical protein
MLNQKIKSPVYRICGYPGSQGSLENVFTIRDIFQAIQEYSSLIPDDLVKMDDFGIHVPGDLDAIFAFIEQDIEPTREGFHEDVGVGDQFDDPAGKKRFPTIILYNRSDLEQDVVAHNLQTHFEKIDWNQT